MSRVDEPEVVPPPAANSGRRSNFLVRFWRGEYSLGVSYWLFGLLGNIALAFIAASLVALFQTERYDPRAIFGSLVSVWLVTCFILVWQVTGVWRSANRNTARRRAQGKRAVWAGIAKLALVSGLCSSLFTFYAVGLPQIVETSRMVFLNDPDIAAYSIRVMRNGTEAEIAGGFKYGLSNDFTKMLAASPGIKVVHLNSLGGRIGEAIRLNEVLQAQGADTYVSAGCYSACTVAFAAGHNRFLKTGAALGFHAAAFPGATANDLAGTRLDQQRLFLAAGFSKAFVDRALSTPNSQMWMPSADELTAAKVITGTSDGTQFAISGFGRNLTRDRLDTLMMQGIPLLKTIKQHDPKDYQEILAQYYAGYVDGKTEMEVETQGMASILELVRKQRSMADDAVLVEIALLYADQYAALAAKDPSFCSEYSSGGFASLAGIVPAALTDKENELSTRVLETAKTRPEASESDLAELWKKVDARMSEKGMGDWHKLLDGGPVDTARSREYCATLETSYREIAGLPANEAAILMRSLLADK
jgi:hypothetical protein